WGHPDDALVPELDLLGWDALGRLQEDGVELGAHTRTHPDLTALREDAALRDELEGCALRMEAETGRRPRAFAYPFGHHDERCVEAVGDLYDVAVTTELRPLGPAPDPRRLPRLEMVYFRRPGLLDGWGSAAFRRYLWLRRAGRRVRAMARQGGRS
ncbi:MAG: polysaccharide deacetylase family protein, partial [Gemmatimonadota bacterium]